MYHVSPNRSHVSSYGYLKLARLEKTMYKQFIVSSIYAVNMFKTFYLKFKQACCRSWKVCDGMQKKNIASAWLTCIDAAGFSQASTLLNRQLGVFPPSARAFYSIVRTPNRAHTTLVRSFSLASINTGL